MSGLILNLKAGEKFLVNGVVLQNGPKRTQIRVETEGANILRLSDALHPNEASTPVKRVYYIAQLILTGDLSQEDGRASLIQGITDLQNVFRSLAEEQLEKALQAAEKGRYYSVLYSLKAVFPVEEELLTYHKKPAAEAESEAELKEVA